MDRRKFLASSIATSGAVAGAGVLSKGMAAQPDHSDDGPVRADRFVMGPSSETRYIGCRAIRTGKVRSKFREETFAGLPSPTA